MFLWNKLARVLTIEAFVVEKPAEQPHFRRQPGVPNSRSPGPQGRERAATDTAISSIIEGGELEVAT
jgi:hypothetical protein